MSANREARGMREAPDPYEEVFSAQSWEDPDVEREAFAVRPNDCVLSMASGGCNTLALLVDNPREVYALSLLPWQGFLLDLKMAAFSALDYGEMLEFMGVRPSARRGRLYRKVRPALKDGSRLYWDARLQQMGRGIIHLGCFERYLRFVQRAIGYVKGKKLPLELFAADDLNSRLRLYRKRWDAGAWRPIMRFFFSKIALRSILGYGAEPLPDGPWLSENRLPMLVEEAVMHVSLRANYFASYLLLGRFLDEDHLPPYLSRQNFSLICSRLPRIRSLSAPSSIQALRPSSIQKFTLSNSLESMPKAAARTLARELMRVGAHNAVITWRGQRTIPEGITEGAGLIQPDLALTRELRARDRSLTDRRLTIAHLNKRPAEWREDSTPRLALSL